ncbi:MULTISPECIES: hypothetical protein [Companilactobacillus]|nr:hypothetical protein [Companilactobacillus heilongjiangensis]
MRYKVTLDTKRQLFTVFDKKNTRVSACGKSIEEAMNKLLKMVA